MAIKRPDRTPAVEMYFPDVIAPAKEYKKLAAAEDPEFELAADNLWEWMKNTFVYDTDEAGLERWESMLSIHPEAGEDDDSRRAAILARMNITPPYTERWLANTYNRTYGDGKVVPVVTPGQYELDIMVDNSIKNAESPRILRFTRSVVPANLGITVHYTYYPKAALHIGMYKRYSQIIKIYPAGIEQARVDKSLYVGTACKTTQIINIQERR